MSAIDAAAKQMPKQPTVRIEPDSTIAKTIRNTVAMLNTQINAGKQAGLKIELHLGTLGKPEWIGVKISREY